MSWDLAISEHGDAVITGHGDLGGKSGTDLLEQRMLIRLRLVRGSWIYDDSNSLGSLLHNVVGQTVAQAQAVVPVYVREALRSIEEIIVQDVQVTGDDKTLTLIVFYRVSEIDADSASRTLTIALPLAGGGV